MKTFKIIGNEGTFKLMGDFLWIMRTIGSKIICRIGRNHQIQDVYKEAHRSEVWSVAVFCPSAKSETERKWELEIVNLMKKMIILFLDKDISKKLF